MLRAAREAYENSGVIYLSHEATLRAATAALVSSSFFGGCSSCGLVFETSKKVEDYLAYDFVIYN